MSTETFPPQKLRLLISGRVQGVGYRAAALHKARSLGLCGWVRNLRSGQVELCAEGPKEVLEELVEWCRRGPPAARVTFVETTPSAATGEFHDFTVQSDT